MGCCRTGASRQDADKGTARRTTRKRGRRGWWWERRRLVRTKQTIRKPPSLLGSVVNWREKLQPAGVEIGATRGENKLQLYFFPPCARASKTSRRSVIR